MKRTIWTLAALALPLGATAHCEAAMIFWSAAQGIKGDTDVDTTGSLVGALNLGDTGVATTTVNGVTFDGLALTGNSASSGNFTLDTNPQPFKSSNGGTSANPPFANLSAPYRTLLSTIGSAPTPDIEIITPQPITLTMKELTVGHSYEFEWWCNFTLSSGLSTTATAGNSVTLSENTGKNNGGVGQFAIGTFTADAASQVITFNGATLKTDLNGFQLRDITVPQPSSLTLLSLGALGLLGYGWRQRMQVA
jgi:hypothetical protein